MPDDHSVLPPSSAGTWVHCTAWVKLVQTHALLMDEETDASREGDLAHAYLRSLLFPHGGDIVAPTVPPDMAAYIAPVAEHIRIMSGSAAVASEQVVRMPSVHPEMWGTCDAYSIDLATKTIRVWDLKYGWGVVEAYENWQLLSYAAGLYDLIPNDAASWVFELYVAQPRPWHREGTIRLWRLSAPALSNHVRHLRQAAEEAMGDNARTVTGPWCKHCEARHVCPALRLAAADVIDVAAGNQPDLLPPDTIGIELTILNRAADVLKARLAGLEALSMSLLRKGQTIPGWGIEHAPGREKWMIPEAQVVAMSGLVGTALAAPVKAITPKQAREAGVDPALIAPFVDRIPGKATLAPVDASVFRKD